MTDRKFLKWHPMDKAAAEELAKATETPGVFYPVQLPIGAAPNNFQAMPGAVSYLASNFLSPITSSNGLTIGGELVVARTEANLVKNYNFMVATSSDGRLHFCGPFKDFPAHHVNTSSPVAVESLFGHTPASKKRVP